MRIAIIQYDLTRRGGSERLVTEVGDRLERRGYDVSYVTSKFDTGLVYEKLRRKVIIKPTLAMRRLPGSLVAYFSILNMLEPSARLVERTHPDVLLFSTNYPLLYPLRFLSKRPALMYVHWPEMWYASRLGFLRRAYRLPVDKLEERSFSVADGILANSRFTAHLINATFSRVADVAYPGVDSNFFTPSRPEESRRSTLLTVNRFADNKNLELAIEAMPKVLQEVPDAKLVIAGSLQDEFRGYSAKLERLIRQLNLQHAIKMRINISEEEILSLYKSCGIFLYTPYGEHFGIGPLEAMACGKPVIACNYGGPRETVIDGHVGFTLPNDSDMWASKIVQLLHDPELWIKMSKNAREHVVRNFSWEKTTDAIERMIVQVAG